MNVSLFDLKAQNGALERELQETFLRVLRSGHFILGPEVEKFERGLAEFNGAEYALGVSSGTDAILLALMALGIGPGDEVLCPTFTFFATAGCVARVGATPVFVDSCPVCFNMDAADAARKVTAQTRAILPVHLFGQAADMDAIMDLAEAKSLHVIEDAAQAMGATYRGVVVGTTGDFGTFSFFPTKNLGAFGDAGAVVTNNKDLYEHAKILRMHGMDPKYYHAHIGGNFRIDALQAALLNVKLPHFKGYTEARRRNAALYTERLSALPGVATPPVGAVAAARRSAGARRQGCCGLVPSPELENAKIILPAAVEWPHDGHIWNQYTLRVLGAGRRDALRAHLTSKGIGAEIYYPLPLHEQACFAYLGVKPEDLIVAHQLASEVISLPIYPELPREQLEQVSAAIGEFLK
jgi:dTDP-4-amino-4,6-dideoxygalactose transaminase